MTKVSSIVRGLQNQARALGLDTWGNRYQLFNRIQAAQQRIDLDAGNAISDVADQLNNMAQIIDSQGDALAASNRHLRNMMIGFVVFPLASAAIYYGTRAVINFADQFFGQRDLINKKQKN